MKMECCWDEEKQEWYNIQDNGWWKMCLGCYKEFRSEEGKLNNKELRKLLDEISVDLQVMCEDNEILRAEIEDYFSEKIIIQGE